MKNNKKRNYLQGTFKPVNPEKYKGTYPIIYRSSLELRYFRFLDQSKAILTWSSESVVVPYHNPLTGRTHRYFIDNTATMRDPKTGNIVKYLIEIKPHSKLQPPSSSNKRSAKNTAYLQKEYVQNKAKWTAASQWSDKHGYKFLILTEKNIINS
jgi:hypothetical protein